MSVCDESAGGGSGGVDCSARSTVGVGSGGGAVGPGREGGGSFT